MHASFLKHKRTKSFLVGREKVVETAYCLSFPLLIKNREKTSKKKKKKNKQKKDNLTENTKPGKKQKAKQKKKNKK